MSVTGKAPVREPSSAVAQTDYVEPSVVQESVATRQTLLAYLRIFLENRKFLWHVGVYALASSVLIAFLIPVRYQTLTRLMPPDNVSGIGTSMLPGMTGGGSGPAGGLGGLAGFAGDLLGAKSSGALFVGILGSETVQDSLIADFDLRRVYGVSKIEDARDALSAHTAISEDRKSGLITISVTDRDPKRGAAMAQAYVTQLDSVVARVSTSAARRERIFLEGRLRDVKQDLDASAHKFSEFASKNTAIDIPEQGKAMVGAAAILQGQLIAAQSQLRGLEEIYTDNNVRVRSLQARVRELGRQLEKMGAGGTAGESTDENSLYPSIRKLPLLGVTYFDLFRQTKIEETVYGLLTAQYELAKVQEAKEIPSVKVLDTALVPTKKSFPPRRILVFWGTFFALISGMVWVVAKERWNRIDPSDPRKAFARDVVSTFKAEMPRISLNGSGSNGTSNRVGGAFARLLGRHRDGE